jgi:hypothetical protein
MNIYAQIYDNNGAFRVYNLPDTIIVQPDFTSLSDVEQGLISKNMSFETNKILNVGSYLPSLQEIQPISSLLNEQSLRDMLGLIESLNKRNVLSTFPQIYGLLNNYDGVLAVILYFNLYLNFEKTEFLLSKHTIYFFILFLIKNSNITGDFVYWISRNRRSQARDALALYLNGLSVSDMDSVRTQLGMLSLITSRTDEITRDTEVIKNLVVILMMN